MINKDIIVKRAAFEDISQIHTISSACDFTGWSEFNYQQELSRKSSFLIRAKLKVENLVVGFLLARVTGQMETAENDFVSICELDVVNIGVLAKFRQKRVGTLLMKSLFSYASKRKIESIWLEVRRSNEPALNFYKKHGFSKVQIRKCFYANPIEDAIVMKLLCSNINVSKT